MMASIARQRRAVHTGQPTPRNPGQGRPDRAQDGRGHQRQPHRAPERLYYTGDEAPLDQRLLGCRRQVFASNSYFNVDVRSTFFMIAYSYAPFMNVNAAGLKHVTQAPSTTPTATTWSETTPTGCTSHPAYLPRCSQSVTLYSPVIRNDGRRRPTLPVDQLAQ